MIYTCGNKQPQLYNVRLLDSVQHYSVIPHVTLIIIYIEVLMVKVMTICFQSGVK